MKDGLFQKSSHKCPSANKRTISPQKGSLGMGGGVTKRRLSYARGANYDNAHCIIGRGSPLYNAFLQIYFLIQRQPARGLNTNISTELTIPNKNIMHIS